MTRSRHCTFCGQVLVEKEYEGRFREYCPACQKVNYRNPVPATAAIVSDELGRILLVKRGMPPKAGEWCLPGGYIELDEEADESCQRELLEETGLSGSDPSLIGVYHSDSPFYHSVLVNAFHLRVDDYSSLQAGDDSTDCRFYPVDELPALAFRSHQLALEAFLRRKGFGPRVLRAPWGAYLITSGQEMPLVEAAIRGGVRIVQYRDKTAQKGELFRMAKQLRRITAAADVQLIINDHADLALAVDADGVHIGQDDMPIESLRSILPARMLIGLSTHSREQAMSAMARGADYIGCGPLFATPTKAQYRPVGLDLLAWVMKHVSIPVVAIGGIDMNNLQQVKEAGARNVAMVRAFASDTAERIARVNQTLK